MISSTWSPITTDPLGTEGLVVLVVVQAAKAATMTIAARDGNVDFMMYTLLSRYLLAHRACVGLAAPSILVQRFQGFARV